VQSHEGVAEEVLGSGRGVEPAPGGRGRRGEGERGDEGGHRLRLEGGTEDRRPPHHERQRHLRQGRSRSDAEDPGDPREGEGEAPQTDGRGCEAGQDEKPTTLVLKLNIEKFDNGSAAARLVPFAGKAQVDLRCQFTNAADPKKVLAEVTASAKEKGGVIGGGSDAEVLWHATHMANTDVYMYMKKLTGFDYSFWSGLGEGIKMGTKDEIDIMKEEKQEKQIMEKKTKKK
jgi:hypothetical protein